MKKIFIFIFLNFLLLNFSIAYVENHKDQKRNKISKKDIAKIVAVLSGTAFFMTAGPMSYYVKLWGLKQEKPHETAPPLKGLASYILLPFSILIGAAILNIDKTFFGRKMEKVDENYMLNLFIISTTLASLVPTFLLIKYSLKKMKESRSLEKPNFSKSK